MTSSRSITGSSGGVSSSVVFEIGQLVVAVFQVVAVMVVVV